MIYLQTIGTNNRMIERMAFGKWSDNYGNKYISSRGSYQKIRIDSTLEEEYDNDTSFNQVYATANSAAWNTPKGSIAMVNNKNMNISLKKNRYKTTEDIDHHLIYVVIDRVDFKSGKKDFSQKRSVPRPSINMIEYSSAFNIVSTFTSRDSNYIGCAISANSLELSGDLTTDIMTIYFYDENSRRFSCTKIVYDASQNSVNNYEYPVNSAKEFDLKQERRLIGDNTTLKFKINERENELITAAYVTKPAYKEAIEEATSKIRNSIITTIGSDSDLSEATASAINSLTTGKDRIRAVTLVGYEDDEITDSIMNANNLLYLFNYDPTDKTLKCIKSL